MKKVLAIAACLAMVLSLAACGGNKPAETTAAPAETTAAPAETTAAPEETTAAPEANVISTRWGDLPADGPEIQLNLASDAVENAIHSQAAYYMLEEISKETQGKITITYYPNAQLGSDTEILNSTVIGEIDMDLMSGALAQSIVPESCLFNIPFLNNIADLDAIIKTMGGGEFRDAYNACYEKAGLKLMVLSLGQSWELNTKEKVTTLDELKGLKIRTPQGDSYMAIWTALGANPTPLAYSELYTSLQQGLVDGHDNMLGNILSVKFYEQAPYVMMTNHNFGSFTIVMNGAKFDTLPAEYQAVLGKACGEWSEYMTHAFQDAQDVNRKDLEALGVEFYDLTDEQIVELKEKGASGIETVEGLVQNPDIIELYRTVLESNK